MTAIPVDQTVASPRSKKLLVILGAAFLVVALAAGGAWFYVSKQRAALDESDEDAPAEVQHKGPPSYLPLDNMVVNLADPGGEKVAQVGITLELSDSKATEKVKQYLPTIRSGVLMLISQRTSEDLLQREGKEKLATDILQEALRPFGGTSDVHASEPDKKAGAGKARPTKKDKARGEMPVQRVLFSSFIVQ